MTSLTIRRPTVWLAAALSSVIILLGLAPASSQATAVPCTWIDYQPNQATVSQIETCVTIAINNWREIYGLRRLTYNANLANAARSHSNEEVQFAYFSHNSFNGTPFATRLQQFGYTPIAGHAYYLGENLAWGSGANGTPRAIVRNWFYSPEHQQIMLSSRFWEIGVGVAKGSPTRPQVANSITVTADFGIR